MIRSTIGLFDVIAGPGRARGGAARAQGRRPFQLAAPVRGPRSPVPWHHRTTPTGVLRQLWTRAGWRSGQEARAPPSRGLFGSFRAQMGPKPGSQRQFRFSSPRKSQSGGSAEPLSLSARLKKLSREYGWSAVGIYLGLSVLDFPFCFLLVRTLGTERIAKAEEFVVENVKKAVPESVKDLWHEYLPAIGSQHGDGVTTGAASGEEAGGEGDSTGWGVKEAEARNKAEPSLATQLALAYAIHKSFIFIRVPLTAAVTPKVVKVLRSWGWQIGKRRAK